MSREKVCGIYCITNLCNRKKYIGQSSDIYARWNHHRSNLRKGTHINKYLQQSVNKYGLKSFAFDVLERVEVAELDEKERYWIRTLKTIRPYGYNLTDGGGGLRGWRASEEAKERLRKPVICLNDMQVYKSVAFAEEATGIERTMIQHCCLGYSSYARNANNDITAWAYLHDYQLVDDKEEYVRLKFENAERVRNRMRGNSIPIVRLNDRKIFPCAKAAAIESGLRDGGKISQVAQGRVKSAGKNAHGERFVWRYVCDFETMTEDDITRAVAQGNKVVGKRV